MDKPHDSGPTGFNALTNPQFVRDPFPMLAELRERHGAVRIRPGLVESFHLFRDADIRAVLLDPEGFSSDRSLIGGGDKGLSEANLGFLFSNLISATGEKHRRLRMIANRVFMPNRIESYRAVAEKAAGEAVDMALSADSFEAVEEFAAHVSVSMITAILGLPMADKKLIRKWSHALSEFSGAVTWLPRSDGRLEEEGRRTEEEMAQYFAAYVEERRAKPRDGDVISAFLHMEGEERLSRDEILSMAMLLLLAGNETTTNLIVNFLRRMAMHPDQAEILRADPALVDNAVEETVRLHPSIRNIDRYATRDCSFCGIDIPAGAQMVLWLAAANRDPRAFPDPDRFDATRRPNRHLGFGAGVHMCLGAPLARLQTRIVAAQALRRTRAIELIGEAVLGPAANFEDIRAQHVRFVTA
jgi:cytochrome P450